MFEELFIVSFSIYSNERSDLLLIVGFAVACSKCSFAHLWAAVRVMQVKDFSVHLEMRAGIKPFQGLLKPPA